MSTKPRSNSISSSTISDESEDTVKNAEEEGQAVAAQLEKEIFGETDDEDLSDLEDMDVFSDEDESKKLKSSPLKTKPKKPTPDDRDYDYVDQGPSKQKIKVKVSSSHKKRRAITQSDKYILDSDEEGNEKGKQREAEEYGFESQDIPKRRKTKRRKPREPEPDADESSRVSRPLTPFEEIARMVDKQFDEMLKSTSSRKRKKNDLDYDAQNDDTAQRLYSKMIKCADTDQNTCSEGKISFARMNYLDDAYKLLTRPYLTESLMDHNILEAIRAWLEPLPDQSLPPIELQEQMLTVLDRLPINIEQIRTSHIGKIVRFYMICPRFDQKVQRMAEDLVYKWTRMAFNKTADYRQRPMKTVEYDPQEFLAKYNPNELLSKIEDEQQREASSGRMHARIPLPAARDYDYVPIVKNPVITSGRNAGSKKFTGVYKRINKKMLQLQRGR